MLDDQLLWLISSYNYKCNDNLKPLLGVEIQTLDNPGWRVKIRLAESYSKDKHFQEIAFERTENDWIFCKIENSFFIGACGIFNLAEVMESFINWIENDQIYIGKESCFHSQTQLDLDNLKWLSNWFNSHCDGDWEHMFGINIETIDNSGWSVTIIIRETELEDKIFKKIHIERSKKDWLELEVEEGIFQGNCGNFNLIELLQTFRIWAKE